MLVVSGVAVAFWLGMGLQRWLARRAERHAMPYRWTCSTCSTRLAGSDGPTVLRLAENHERIVHGALPEG